MTSCLKLVLFLWACIAYACGHSALVLTETGGFRHAVIDTAYNALDAEASARGWSLTRADESEGFFTASSLANYDVVVFFFTTGDTNPGILDANEKSAFQAFIQNGGGFVGVHSATDTYQTQWPWYHQLVGAGFVSHPAVQTATVRIEDHSHSSVAHLPHRWVITDEWYNFNFAYNPPRDTLHVIATLDETTYSGGSNGADHPIAWCHLYDGGRSWYTGLGHEAALWSDADFLKHIMDGLAWAEGEAGGDAQASLNSQYVKSTIYGSPNQPVGGAVPTDPNDERVFWIERTTGNVWMYRPSTGQSSIVQTIPVFNGLEDGLMGIAFDPDFINNQFVYFFYSPVGIVENRISRFTMNGDSFSLATEVVVLSIPTQRAECCHSGGHMKFGPDGNLWLTVGDNTNPFASNGYSPIDERTGREPWDAQRTSANTNDLRGKIIRITIQPDGSYTCPPGNLFPTDATHRCEYYVMGNRNPYRMAVNPFLPQTIYWGEVGPDAGSSDPNRGPAGHDEVNKASSAGNFGWPYCVANNLAYNDYNFATGASGALFDCANPINESPNNNGALNLPSSIAPFVWYSGGSVSDPEAVPTGGGRTAEAPYMHVHETNRLGSCALPPYFNNSLIFAEWSRDKLRNYIMDDSGDLLHALPLWDNFEFRHPIDVFKANDGSIYVVEFGTDFSGSGARISRMCYTAGIASVTCQASGNPTGGSLPLDVQFDGSLSSHSQGEPLTYEWDFDGDQIVDSNAVAPQHTYTTSGDKVATLRVYQTSDPSVEAICTVNIAAGNNVPVITHLQPPLEGGIIDWDYELVHEVRVDDVEDGSTVNGINCSDVTLESSTGHEDHAHGFSQTTGCITVSQIDTSQGHDEYLDWVYWVVGGSYLDNGATGVSPALGTELRQLHPRMRQVEKFSAAANPICEQNNQLARFSPVAQCTETTTDSGGGLNVGWINNGQWLRYDNYNPHNVLSVSYRVASVSTNPVVGNIDLLLDDPVTGTVISSTPVPGTGGWQTWTTVGSPLLEPNQIFDIDLGSEFTVSGLILDSAASPNDYPRGYQIYVAGTDQQFGNPVSPVHRAEPNPSTSAVQQITLCQEQNGVRYVRIMQTGDDSVYWWSIHELQVLDSNSQSLPISSVSASRENSAGGEIASLAIDGDPATRWSTGEPQNGGPYQLFLGFRQEPGQANTSMFNINWFRFDGGAGMSRPSGAPITAHAINSAGSQFTDSSGISYDADRDFTSSSTATVTNAIANTVDDALYQSERWANAGSFTYSLSVTAGKQYKVTFKLAEIYTGITGAGQRVFDILVDGSVAAQDVDLYALAGPFTAYDIDYTFTAASNTVSIQFLSNIENAKSGAILLQELTASSPAVPTCQSSTQSTPAPQPSPQPTPTQPTPTQPTPTQPTPTQPTPTQPTPTQPTPTQPTPTQPTPTPTPVPECTSDSQCDNGLVCDGIELCVGGSCQAGAPLNCDDSNPCTADSCVEPTGCQNVPSGPVYALAYANNCGRDTEPFLASDGYTYQPDQYFLNGNRASGNDPISGTTDDYIYQSERWAKNSDGQVNYEFPVTSGTTYRVTLKFAETYNNINGPGQRVFDVFVEGIEIASDVDLYALVGADAAYDIQYTYVAGDALLDIDFVSNVQNAKISAILVEEVICA